MTARVLSANQARFGVALAMICTGLVMLPAVGWPEDPHGVWSTILSSGPSPGPRNQHGAVYDPVGDRMILYGGSENLNDVWSLSLSATPEWTNLNPSNSPTGRKAMCLAYDSLRDRVIMFGGYDGNYQNDVWALDLTGTPSWTELHPAGTPPSGRMFSLAVYDLVRDRLLIFGGHPESLNDVWELSLSTLTWTQITPSGTPPPQTYGHAGVFDPIADRLIVFGGTSGTYQTFSLSFEGSPAWSQIASAGPHPSARALLSAVYDEARRRMVIYAGSGLADVWALSLPPGQTEVWEQLLPTGPIPPGRQLHTAVYQTTLDRMIVYGPGSDVLALTWESDETPAFVSGFSPGGGQVGDPVQVFGVSFSNASNVAFNGVSAPIAEQSANRILTSVPPGATTGPISVTTPLGTYASTDSFFVGEIPEVTAAVPDSAKAGVTVTLAGQYFTGASKVSFGGGASDASFLVNSDTSIEAVVDPAGTTGPISVTTPVGTGTSSFTFHVLPPDTAARIVRVKDVPADQGGWVVVRWLRSDLDHSPRRDITGYRVWRRAAEGSDAAAARLQPPDGWQALESAGEITFWEPMAVIPSAYLEGYAYTAPTTQDSMATGNPFTAFFIQALTADPFVFYNSKPDSGYSVDNLAPPQPEPFAVVYSRGSNALHWKSSDAPDLLEFRLHRGLSIGFPPGPSNLILATRDTGYVDGPGLHTYKLIAVDQHGNLSPPAVVSYWVTTAVPAAEARMRLAALNPNLDGRLRVEFTLIDTSPAKLDVMDVAGRVQRSRQVISPSRGPHTIDFAEEGLLSPGIYFVRLTQGGMELHARAAVVK